MDNATSSLVRFENENNFYKFEETRYPTTTLALCVVVNFQVVGLAPAHKSLLRLQHKFNKFSAEIGFEKWLP
jgi:hypothetical protein